MAAALGATSPGVAGCGDTAPALTGSGGSTSSGDGGAATSSSTSGSGGSGAATQTSAASGGAGSSTGQGGSPPSGLSILAWNLEQFPLTASAPALVEEVLAELQPDVVGVEEIEDDAAFFAMADTLPGYQAIIADDPFNYTRVGMLYREDAVTVDAVETLFLDDSYAFPRPPLKAHLTVQATGFDFDFVVIHLKAQIDAASEARRLAGCNALDSWIQKRLADGLEGDIVLAGDYNDKITDAPDHNVFEVFLAAPEQYRFLTQEVVDDDDYSYIPFTSLIDHVLVTTSVLAAYGNGSTQAVHLESTVAGYESSVSDHRPILTRFASP